MRMLNRDMEGIKNNPMQTCQDELYNVCNKQQLNKVGKTLMNT